MNDVINITRNRTGFITGMSCIKQALMNLTDDALAHERKLKMEWLDKDLDIDEDHKLRANYYMVLALIEWEMERRDIEWREKLIWLKEGEDLDGLRPSKSISRITSKNTRRCP